MFRPGFEAIFRPFVVEQLIKFLHMDVSVLWDPKQLYRIIEIHEFTKQCTLRRAKCIEIVV
jgi:hypothetical protein